MSGQSSQSGWNSWFGPDGEPEENADTKAGVTSAAESGAGEEESAQVEPQVAPQIDQRVNSQAIPPTPLTPPTPQGSVWTAAPRTFEAAGAGAAMGADPAAGSRTAAEGSVGETERDESDAAGTTGAADVASRGLVDDLAGAETLTAATVLASLSGFDAGEKPAAERAGKDAAAASADEVASASVGGSIEPPELPAPIWTAPPEPSTWSAPPALEPIPSAEQETALVRPVRLEPDLLPTQIVQAPAPTPTPTPTPADDQPTQVVPDVAPTQRVAPVWSQPSEPAQLWGAPREPFGQQNQQHQQNPYQQHQPQPSPFQAAAASPQPGYAAETAAATPADEEWDDWDDDASRRRVSPPPAVGGGGDRFGNGSGSGGGSGRNGSGSGGGRGSRKKILVGSGGVVAVGVVLVLLFTQVLGHSTGKPTPSGFQPTATAPADAAKETATAFLTAWQSGNLQQAAKFTDNPAQALSTLTAYRKNLNLAGLQLSAETSTATTVTPQVPAGGSTPGAVASATPGPGGNVTFSVDAKVGVPSSTASASSSASASSTSSAAASASDTAAASASSGSTSGSAAAASPTAEWTYTSHLTAYEQNGGWWIQWTPGLVAPNLTAATKVVSIAIPAQAGEVTDSTGNNLSDAADAGLRNIAAALKKNATGQGTPGIEVQLQNADGTAVSGTTAKLSAPVNTNVLKTTIDAQVEGAAMNAVEKYQNSSMVVIRPSTGEILAVANNDGQNDFALTARIAPGSTNKIITSTALLTSGLVSSTAQAVECPKTVTIDGLDFGNSAGESLPAGTPFLEDFADSCNNAFTQWYDKIGSTTLAQTAQKYYGLNQQWDIGLGAAGPYYNIPASTSNGELAMELFGQGRLTASPLAMASVAATVDSGSFRQPIVVPGAAQLSATPLPTNVQQGLWKMMHAVTQSGGTAAGVYSGVSDEVYAKTGTADVDPTATNAQKPNSWMVVFDPKADLAIGCVVLNAGFGASYAGPETAAVLEALQ